MRSALEFCIKNADCPSRLHFVKRSLGLLIPIEIVLAQKSASRERTALCLESLTNGFELLGGRFRLVFRQIFRAGYMETCTELLGTFPFWVKGILPGLFASS